jgi:transposase
MRESCDLEENYMKKSVLTHRRHDISDKVWALLEQHLPGRAGDWGGNARDNRQFINAVFWIIRTGAPWRDLPPDLGHWSNTHRRFIRWRDKGIWEKVLEILVSDVDYEWLMIDATHCKVHPHAAGAVGGNQDMSRSKGGSTPKYIWPWMRLVCRSEYLLHVVPQQIAHKLQN